MEYYCFGDSLTLGSVGHSYIKYLRDKSGCEIKNKGINGDTTMQLYKRLKKHISNTDKHCTIILCVGTNDLLLPYLTSVSTSWRIQMSPRVKAMHCISDDFLFEKQYREIIELVLSKHYEIIVLGLPCLELQNFPNDKIGERNRIIEALAQEYGIRYINTSEIQDRLDHSKTAFYSWNHKNLLKVLEGIFFPVIPSLKDAMSTKRRLNFTVDGVHWNSRFAKAVANEIQVEFMEEE